MMFDKRLQVMTAVLCICILFPGVTKICFADDASVLPKGVWTVSMEDRYYLPIDKRFNHNGDTEDVAKDFNANLNSVVFPGLSAIETGFGLPSGSASLGNSVVSFKYKFDVLDTTIGYGITDRLSAGIKIPYRWSRNEVSAQLDTTNATVGKNPFFGTAADPFHGAPLIPIALGGAKLTTEDVQGLITNGLFINGKLAIPGLGFKRFETWSDSFFEDIEAGLKYQYFKNENWRLAFTGGVNIPTGKMDDPFNLVDKASGNGFWGILFRFQNDYTGVKNLVLNATLRYALNLSRTKTLMVTDVHHPLVFDPETVRVDPGDVVELEFGASYQFLQGSSLSLIYKYGHGFKSNFSGRSRTLTSDEESALGAETDYSEQLFTATLSYSTLPLYVEKKFPVPLNVWLSYRNRFAGTNNLFKSQYIALGLQVFF